MDSQNHSLLFTLLPLEVQQAIFGYLIPHAVHVCLQQDGKVGVSTCVDNSGNNDLDGNERRATSHSSTDKIWARRLNSSWGPHWKCEELALRSASGIGSSVDDSADSCATMLSMLSVCKRMQGELLSLIGNTARVNVTDLETLNHLARGHVKGSLWAIKGLSPRNLDITLRLPIAFFKAIEEWYMPTCSGSTQDPRPESDASPSKEEKMIMLWIEVWPILIPQLEEQKLPSVIKLWLDHDEPFSWTAVNEWATFSALIDSVSLDQTTISEASPLITVNLPLLHPRWERSECHLTQGMPSPASKRLAITRRIRQRYYANGNHVDYSGDFPVMLDLLDPDFGGSYTTREELEADERSWWQRGDNVYQDMVDMGGGFFGVDSTDTFENPRAEQRRRALYPASYR